MLVGKLHFILFGHCFNCFVFLKFIKVNSFSFILVFVPFTFLFSFFVRYVWLIFFGSWLPIAAAAVAAVWLWMKIQQKLCRKNKSFLFMTCDFNEFYVCAHEWYSASNSPFYVILMSKQRTFVMKRKFNSFRKLDIK